MEILSDPALEMALQWLADFLKFELRLPDWEAHVESLQEGGATLYLFPSSWRLSGIDDYVAFSFYWSNESDGDDPCVQLYLPAKEHFPQRNQLLNRFGHNSNGPGLPTITRANAILIHPALYGDIFDLSSTEKLALICPQSFRRSSKVFRN